MRIFISSPGDVGEERELASLVIKRLQQEFAGRLEIDPFFWEHQPLRATASFQEEIDTILRPSEADIVILILWSRLGTRLRPELIRPDGTHYSSGTEYEFEDAVNGHKQRGLPDLLVYRKTARAFADLSLSDEEYQEQRQQKKLVDNFIEQWFKGADGSFTSSLLEFASVREFEEKLEMHLRSLITKRLRQLPGVVTTEAVPPIWQGESPFRGLEVFDYSHAPIFCGRTHAVSEVLHALRHQAHLGSAFVLVMGMSGVGKSSLVRAGVLPRLTQPGVIEGIGLWRWSIFRPCDARDNLLEGLAQALMQEEALPRLHTKKPTELALHLQKSPETVIELAMHPELTRLAAEVQQKERLSKPLEARLVLVVDQMEEIFTLEKVTSGQRQEFIRALAALARSGWVWILATMRSDFFTRCRELQELQELKKGDGLYDLRPATPAEISQMIRQPAAMAGLVFEERGETPGRLDDVLRDAAMANPEALPLLEFVLEELYLHASRDQDHPEVLTFAAYEALGGLQGAIARRADAVFNGLQPAEREAALDQVLANLVNLGLGENDSLTAKRVPVEKVTSTPGSQALVNAFVKARLFMMDRTDEGTTVVGIAHEALLRHWGQARESMERIREILQKKEEITIAANIWIEHDKNSNKLLRGNQLDEAEDLLSNREYSLQKNVVDYVNSSLDTRRENIIGWFFILIFFLYLSYEQILTLILNYPIHGFFQLEYLVSTFFNLAGVGIPTILIIYGKIERKRAFYKDRKGAILCTICLILTIIHYVLSIANPISESMAFINVIMIIICAIIILRMTKISQLIANTTKLFWLKCLYAIIFILLILFMCISSFDQNPIIIRSEYYTNFIRRWGVPEGIGRITAKEASLRNFTYHFVQQAGFINLVKKINGYGSSAGDFESDSLEATFIFRKGECRFDFFKSDKNKEDIHERAYDSYNNSAIDSFIIKKYWNVAVYYNERYLEFFNHDSAIVIVGSLLAHTGSEAGLESEIHFFDKNWLPKASKNGTYGLQQEYNEIGLPININSLGIDRQPIKNNDGYAKITIKYDNNGNLTEWAHWGLDDQPALYRNTHFRRTNKYDNNGNLIESAYFDVNRQLTNCTDNYAKSSNRYDNQGNLFEVEYFGVDGKLTLCRDGYAKLIKKFDDNGNVIEYAYYNVNGQPTSHKNGYFKWTQIYDANGDLTKQELLSIDGLPAKTKVVIKKVIPGGQGEKIGLLPRDRIICYADKEIVNTATFIESVNIAGTAGSSKRTLEVLRQGKKLAFLVDPGLLRVEIEDQGPAEPRGEHSR